MNGETCHEVCKHSNRARKTAVLIQKCLDEQETLGKLKDLPFQDPDDQQLKEIVSTLSDDSIIDDVLDFIASKLKEEHFERESSLDPKGENVESRVNRQDFVNEWSTEFSHQNITSFAQLSLPAFEDWPILVSVPAVVVCGLERVLEAKSSSLMEDIKCFSAVSKVADVLYLANHLSANKFSDHRARRVVQ